MVYYRVDLLPTWFLHRIYEGVNRNPRICLIYSFLDPTKINFGVNHFCSRSPTRVSPSRPAAFGSRQGDMEGVGEGARESRRRRGADESARPNPCSCPSRSGRRCRGAPAPSPCAAGLVRRESQSSSLPLPLLLCPSPSAPSSRPPHSRLLCSGGRGAGVAAR